MHLLGDRVAQQVAVLEQLSGAEADLLCTDGIAALDLNDEALACVFKSNVELWLPALMSEARRRVG